MNKWIKSMLKISSSSTICTICHTVLQGTTLKVLVEEVVVAIVAMANRIRKVTVLMRTNTTTKTKRKKTA
jgi:hypothetical protein